MEPGPVWHITSFYRFTPIEEIVVGQVKATLFDWLAEREMRGLVLVAPEGLNGTVAGSASNIDDFKAFVQNLVGLNDFRFKDATSAVRPFRRLTVDRREEIVGLKRPDLVPQDLEDHHLTPRQWHEWLLSDRQKLVIDTRNQYETVAGKFKGAIDPQLSTFSDWSKYLDKAEIPKDTPVLMYCTGGIRCEKAILEMRSRGFDQVYQLRDGILGYLAEYPEGEFEGECFVFDDRVTVGPDLQPTGHFGICPGCGLTASKVFICEWCNKEFFCCPTCEAGRPSVCSKTCLDKWKHLGRGNGAESKVEHRTQE